METGIIFLPRVCVLYQDRKGITETVICEVWFNLFF